MRQTQPPADPLSPHRAFVVQLRQGTALAPKRVQGRIKHVTSGRATDFCSLDACPAFMVQVLTPPTEQAP
jgi:hypothetical protein